MRNKLFCGGLPWAVDDARLHEAFSEFGTVTEAKVILDRETGRSRGFGFITYEDEASAEAAIQAMDGQDFDGRRINVRIAEPRSGGGGGRGGRGGFGGGGGGRGGYGGGGGGRGGYGGGGGGGRGGYGGGGGGGYGGGGGGGRWDD